VRTTTPSDRRARLVSGSVQLGGTDSVAGLAGPGPASWPGPVSLPAATSSFLFFSLSFLFYLKTLDF
jgi:hypothetical protein